MEDGDGLRWWQRIELKGAGGVPRMPAASSDPGQPRVAAPRICMSRPRSPRQTVTPKPAKEWQSLRSVGLVPLTLDRGSAPSAAYPGAPDKAVPLTRLEVTATSPNSQGRVVLAAVDRGVLNISDYQPLGPFAIFFGRKALRPGFVRQLRPK